MTKITQYDYMPVGSIIAFLDIDSVINNINTRTTDLKNSIEGGLGWYVCNGTTTTDLAANKELPDLNGDNRFLRGSTDVGNLVTGVGGESTHVLTIAEMPNHAHYHRRVDDWSSNYVSNVSGGAFKYLDKVNKNYDTETVGSDSPHENKPPYKNVIWLVRLRREAK